MMRLPRVWIALAGQAPRWIGGTWVLSVFLLLLWRLVDDDAGVRERFDAFVVVA